MILYFLCSLKSQPKASYDISYLFNFFLFIFFENHVEMGQLKLKANFASRQVISKVKVRFFGM